MTGKSPFSNLHHVGIMVRDVDKAAEYYESLGIGPFETVIMDITERRLRGKLVSDVDAIKPKIKQAHVGPIRFELIQPVPGKESIWGEFLENKGEGIQHLAFVVDDSEKEEAELVKKGLNVIYSSKFQKGGSATYFETDKIGGVVFELFQRPRE